MWWALRDETVTNNKSCPKLVCRGNDWTDVPGENRERIKAGQLGGESSWWVLM